MEFNIDQIELSGGFKKDNFLSVATQSIPKTLMTFQEWLKEYAIRVKWESLFGNRDRIEKYGGKIRDELLTIRFEHVPLEMQIGILLAFIHSRGVPVQLTNSNDISQPKTFIKIIIDALVSLEKTAD